MHTLAFVASLLVTPLESRALIIISSTFFSCSINFDYDKFAIKGSIRRNMFNKLTFKVLKFRVPDLTSLSSIAFLTASTKVEVCEAN